MEQPIRILHVLGGVNLGGAESRIMDLYRNIDREKLQFDFIVHTKEEGYFQKEIESMGGMIYQVPRFRFINICGYIRAWKDFFTEHTDYQAVHGHMTSTASLYLSIAKKTGVPITIAHARSAGTDPGLKGLLTKLLRKNLYKRCDYCLACSKLAGEAVFGKKQVEEGKVHILPNGIETEKYDFNPNVGSMMREALSLQDKWVIGHVGRFHHAKNHEFLIDVFEEITKKKENAVLLLLGEGPLMEPIQKKVASKGLTEKVRFLGSKSPISNYYQVIDFLIFPSVFEGMPGTIIEAQASGLRCLVSDCVTEEVKVTDLVEFYSLKKSPSEWADYVIAHKDYERRGRVEELKAAGFDVENQVQDLQKIYGIGV